MPGVKLSCGEQALKIIETASKTVAHLHHQSEIEARLDELAIKTNSIISLLYSYTLTEIETIDTDDEILNWTIPDVANELSATIWNMSSAFYKTAASCLRSALEMGIVSLYFQILENEKPNAKGYNEEFSGWDGGETSTPNWGKMKPKIKQHKNVKQFTSAYGYCPIQAAHDYFKYLCSFTHSRSYSPEDGKGTNSMNMKNEIGCFHEEEFLRISEAMNKTIAMISSTWAIIYPHMVKEWTNDSMDSSFVSLNKMFDTPHAVNALYFAKNKKSIS